MRRFLLCTGLLAGMLAAHAQKTIHGKVFDAATLAPLYGATISLPDKSIVTTDKDGGFNIPCENINAITVSFIGYESTRWPIRNCTEEPSIGLVSTDHNLDEVEITATSNLNKSVLYQPSSIVKLGKVELKRGLGLYLDDAINANVPGVTLQRRGVSSGQQFNIRGYGNGVRGTNGINSNFDGQGSKVYLNGIPVTDAEGITLMDDIDFASIGNVEITKGPAGTLYGLAIAGVVNLKTIKPPSGKTAIGQDVLIGSYGLQRYTTHFEMGKERSSLLVNYGRQTSDGYLPHNASTKNFVNMAGDWQPNEKQSVTAYFGFSNSYDQRAGELTITQFKNNDYTGNPNYIKNDAHSETVGFRAGLGHTYHFNQQVSNSTSVFVSGISNNASSAGGWTDKSPINYGLRSVMDTRFSLNEKVILSGITGVELQQQRAQIIGYAMTADSNNLQGYNRIGAMRSNQFTITGTHSLFTEWTLALPQAFSITGGIGLSQMKIELNDRLYVATANRAPVTYARTYNGMLAPHIALNKVFRDKVSVYAAYSKGYKAPVSSYFFIPVTGMVNRDLEPEVGNQFEIGSKATLLNDRFVYELAFFKAIFSKKMMAVAVPLNGSTTTTAYSYIANGGKQDNKGIELLVKYTAYRSQNGLIASLMPFLNMTWSDFTYKDFSFQTLNAARTGVITTHYDGKAVAGVSPLTVNAGIDFLSHTGIYGNIVYSYKDAMPITSDGANMTDAYSLLNAKLGFRRNLSRHISADLFAGANNITCTKYPIFVFINQLPDAYIPGPHEINYFGGINVKYNF